VIDDQIGGPTPASEIAKACLIIAAKLTSDKSLSGIYHFSGQPNVSWADFSREIVSSYDSKVKINSIKSSEFNSKALRQKNSRLNCDSIMTKFGIDRPKWKINLKNITKEIVK
jgi:dTDP-4-dehydrorhamnose reductase